MIGKRSLVALVLPVALASGLAGCFNDGLGTSPGAVAVAAYPNINQAPPLPSGHLLSADEAAAEAARLRSIGQASQRSVGGSATADAMARNGLALQRKGAAQTAAAKADLACRVPAGQAKPRGCP